MQHGNTINIIIADDHEIIRRGLKQVLSSEDDMRVVGEASNTAELMDVLKKNRCSVLLLDISMPGRSGLEVLADIRGFYPAMKVLVLSIYSEDMYALRALKCGADGYLTKDTASDNLVHAIRKIASGKKYISDSVAERLAIQLERGEIENPHERLSAREYEVMKMLAHGKRASQIASELFINVKTVSTYRKRILEKLNVKTNAELVRYCIEHHII